MRKIAFLLVTAMLFALLSACGTDLTLMDFVPRDDNYNGFEGYEFVIKGNWPKNWDPYAKDLENELGESALSVHQDAIVVHNAKIMKEYDCKITSVYAEWSWSQNLLLDIVANTIDYDLMDTNASLMIDNMRSGAVIPWEDANIDLSDSAKFGDSGYLQSAVHNEKHYGIWPENWQAMHSYRGVMGVNNELLKGFSNTSVYELYENGKWTFDEFKNLLALFLTDETLMPLTYYDRNMLNVCSILANGSGIVNYDESTDKYVYGFKDQKAVHAIEYVQSLVNEGLAFEDKDYGYYFDESCVSPFYLTETWCLGGNLEDMDMICFPFGPEGEYGVDFSSYRSINERYFFMPNTSYPEEIGRFVNVWFEELDEHPKADIIEDFKLNNFYNDESFDMWMKLSEVAETDYGYAIFDIYDEFFNEMGTAVFENKSLQEFITSYEPLIQVVIDESLNG